MKDKYTHSSTPLKMLTKDHGYQLSKTSRDHKRL